MNEFHIDRQFGVAIHIDVEAGIVQDCHNESEQFCKVMNEKYQGKTIAFLKTDIARAFEGVYMNVRSTQVCDQAVRVWAVQSRINAINGYIQQKLRVIHQNPERAKEAKAELKELETKRSTLQGELYGQESILETIKENVQKLHGFN